MNLHRVVRCFLIFAFALSSIKRITADGFNWLNILFAGITLIVAGFVVSDLINGYNAIDKVKEYEAEEDEIDELTENAPEI